MRLCRAKGLPAPVCEYQFLMDRRFRWDFCWPEHKLALECCGGVWLKGKSGHSSGVGLTRDYEKFSLGAVHGWRLLLVTPGQLNSPRTLAWLTRILRPENS